jgi:hypothetical protein
VYVVRAQSKGGFQRPQGGLRLPRKQETASQLRVGERETWVELDRSAKQRLGRSGATQPHLGDAGQHVAAAVITVGNNCSLRQLPHFRDLRLRLSAYPNRPSEGEGRLYQRFDRIRIELESSREQGVRDFGVSLGQTVEMPATAPNQVANILAA